MSKNQIIKEIECINEYKWKYRNEIHINAQHLKQCLELIRCLATQQIYMQTHKGTRWVKHT